MTFRRALIAIGLLTLAASAQAQDVTNPSPPNSVNGAYNASPPTCVDGHGCWFQTDVNGNLKVTGTVTSSLSGTGANNADNVAAVATGLVPVVNYNYVWDGAAWDRLYGDSTNGAFVNIKAMIALPTGTNSIGTVLLPTTGTIAAGNGVVPATSPEAGAATTASSGTAAASNQVIKASAGNLYDLTVTIGATSGYVMLFDATSLPSNGAVTPVWCAIITSNGTNGGISAAWPAPKRFGTGITAGFSTTGCFTLTASATANFFGDYK